MARSRHCGMNGVRPVEHTRSSVWPLEWVGPWTCCVMLKQSSSDRNSEVSVQLVESTWMLKSPRRSMEEDLEQIEYKTYKIEKEDQSIYSFVFNDIMGIEKNLDHGVNVDDLKLALQGHMKDNYKFNPVSPLTQNDPGYNSNPSLDDKVHVMVGVIPADSVSLLSDEVVQKLRQLRAAATELEIPQMAILTKVDQACPEVKRDINNLHKSKYLKEQVEKFSYLLGLPVNCIFLLKNYESEIDTSNEISVPILAALKQMMNYGDDYLNDH
ncbi:interferon-induced protein 44-like [Cheilinus undulatus]|uniref:interferon-induced protein 44-like n=1 Tax=Cheilinus undulatus TaxID=241271 RepID=UPI001BD2CFFE|nr:interferon-induced protein 44-like [Cheilinus undulatus]